MGSPLALQYNRIQSRILRVAPSDRDDLFAAELNALSGSIATAAQEELEALVLTIQGDARDPRIADDPFATALLDLVHYTVDVVLFTLTGKASRSLASISRSSSWLDLGSHEILPTLFEALGPDVRGSSMLAMLEFSNASLARTGAFGNGAYLANLAALEKGRPRIGDVIAALRAIAWASRSDTSMGADQARRLCAALKTAEARDLAVGSFESVNTLLEYYCADEGAPGTAHGLLRRVRTRLTSLLAEETTMLIIVVVVVFIMINVWILLHGRLDLATLSVAP